MSIKLAYELCSENAVLPQYKHLGDAGMDVYAAEDVIIKAGETVAVGTGLKIYIPEEYEIQLRPRSGLSLNSRLRLPNSPATIDAGYRDEIKVIIWNSSPDEACFSRALDTYTLDVKGSPAGHYHIKKGDRICQMVLKRIEIAEWVDLEQFDENKLVSDRQGGLGHSGLR